MCSYNGWLEPLRHLRLHSLTMLAQPVTYPPRNGYPLHITAKRYWAPEFEANTDGNALTLIVLHSTSFHKETWEPSLEQLFKLASGPGSRVRIREAWALDCPNHGEAGELNERLLAQQGSSCTYHSANRSSHVQPHMYKSPAQSMLNLCTTFCLRDLIMVLGLTSVSGNSLASGIRWAQMPCKSSRIDCGAQND